MAKKNEDRGLKEVSLEFTNGKTEKVKLYPREVVFEEGFIKGNEEIWVRDLYKFAMIAAEDLHVECPDICIIPLLAQDGRMEIEHVCFKEDMPSLERDVVLVSGNYLLMHKGYLEICKMCIAHEIRHIYQRKMNSAAPKPYKTHKDAARNAYEIDADAYAMAFAKREISSFIDFSFEEIYEYICPEEDVYGHKYKAKRVKLAKKMYEGKVD